ncbi:hypothetical protein [Photobacterium lutimaris]|uniref:hypothetical protein n=1 Tax=Photobacterium lutimaris TaxID=388278 RepID=UPI001FB78D02|nr:hypothetical protein [Photobacterium lutimaris]
MHHLAYRPGKYQLGDGSSTLDDEVFAWWEGDKIRGNLHLFLQNAKASLVGVEPRM